MKLTEQEIEGLMQCYNCGEDINEIINGCHGDFREPIAEIFFEPGYPDTRLEPGEPDAIYIICRRCKKEKED